MERACERRAAVVGRAAAKREARRAPWPRLRGRDSRALCARADNAQAGGQTGPVREAWAVTRLYRGAERAPRRAPHRVEVWFIYGFFDKRGVQRLRVGD